MLNIQNDFPSLYFFFWFKSKLKKKKDKNQKVHKKFSALSNF